MSEKSLLTEYWFPFGRLCVLIISCLYIVTDTILGNCFSNVFKQQVCRLHVVVLGD